MSQHFGIAVYSGLAGREVLRCDTGAMCKKKQQELCVLGTKAEPEGSYVMRSCGAVCWIVMSSLCDDGWLRVTVELLLHSITLL